MCALAHQLQEKIFCRSFLYGGGARILQLSTSLTEKFQCKYAICSVLDYFIFFYKIEEMKYVY